MVQCGRGLGLVGSGALGLWCSGTAKAEWKCLAKRVRESQRESEALKPWRSVFLI